MQERHDILARTIGYRDEEQTALKMGYKLITASFVIVIIGTILQAIFFWLYNGKFHPFSKILDTSNTPSGMYES